MRPFAVVAGGTSMYAIRTFCPYTVSGRYETGNGYGTSSLVMLPGATTGVAG